MKSSERKSGTGSKFGLRPWRCPICDAEGHGTTKPTARALAQHIAMMDGAPGIKEEGAHTDWRRKHGISPVRSDTMKKHGVPKMTVQILQIIKANPSLFRISEEIR